MRSNGCIRNLSIKQSRSGAPILTYLGADVKHVVAHVSHLASTSTHGLKFGRGYGIVQRGKGDELSNNLQSTALECRTPSYTRSYQSPATARKRNTTHICHQRTPGKSKRASEPEREVCLCLCTQLRTFEYSYQIPGEKYSGTSALCSTGLPIAQGLTVEYNPKMFLTPLGLKQKHT
ncbi:hypothetical protein M404DRAFT_181126 [Pisolithus tinctorius Marx 270]|uniref:Uncharacterized protein n=1 Tax=Pisolithus tinctorius Marx 270 TaxID=870435 RepID=A0A0C3KYQ8_PISTI|nr:hypothetical protein M404DRAFT_181126 [Pisolithus tinctorius Marx 270]